jgi:quercetin dioxygenase-like cupin family protein
VDFGLLAWNEIPGRRTNDPGARIAELSTNASRTRITSLMDCRPGWILNDHNHPSDVLTFCIRGGGILGIEDESRVYESGDLITVPAGTRHRFETGNEGACLAVFVFEPFLASSYWVPGCLR